MKNTFFKFFVLVVVSLTVSANLIEKMLDNRYALAFDDGTVAHISLNKNRFGIVTATYTYATNEKVTNMVVKTIEHEGVEYLHLHKNRKSPAGTYKYEFNILIHSGFTDGEEVFVDNRVGYYKKPLIFLDNVEK